MLHDYVAYVTYVPTLHELFILDSSTSFRVEKFGALRITAQQHKNRERSKYVQK